MSLSTSQNLSTAAPKVSVVVPCRNEVGHIAACVAGLLALDAPAGGFEVIVADGMSDDGTREILASLEKEVSSQLSVVSRQSSGVSGQWSAISRQSSGVSHQASVVNGPVIRVIDNPGRIVSKGLNTAIRAARGDIIVRADAHTEYAPDYLLRCVEVLEQTNADNVGGPWIARGRSYVSRAIAASFQSPFAVGGARGHNPNYEGFVDTVYLGCWRREIFDRVGYFDEELVRNQDDEHNLRITRDGGNVWQSPKIRSWYRPRDSFWALFRQYMQYGYWKVRVIQKHKLPASLRHLVPGAFVFALFLLSLIFCVRFLTLATHYPFLRLLLWLVAIYGLCICAASIQVAWQAGWKLLAVLPVTFVCYHFGYGLGFWRGVVDFVLLRRGVSASFSELTRSSPKATGLQTCKSRQLMALGDVKCQSSGSRDIPSALSRLDPADYMPSQPATTSKVSVIVPCRNEADSIAACLKGLLAFEDPPGGFEVIVADGISDDGTREILDRFEKEVSSQRTEVSSQWSAVSGPPSAVSRPVIRVIDNPGRITSKGLNAAIRVSRGDIIIRLDAHTDYAPDYLRECVAALQATGADNVGGPARTKADTYLQRAVAAAFHSPFSVGGAHFHDVNYEGWVDTVTYGCWRKEGFEKFGLFDEELVRNQDDEHNLRIIRGGGKVFQSPKIKSGYRPRGSFAALFKQYMQYGYWKVRVVQKHKFPASWRHLVPGAFVLTLLLLFLLSAFSLLFSHLGPLTTDYRPLTTISFLSLWLLIGLGALYGLAVLMASVVTAAKTGWKLLPVLPAVFGCYHFGYGFGFLRGILDFVILRRGASVSFTKLTRGSSDVATDVRRLKTP
jgi:glycosyltransferase involved in cell wall biosynthesis